MLFSQIIPPPPSPTESKRLFYTSVSLLLSYIQGYRYHLSKFHIYALVYCIGVYLWQIHFDIWQNQYNIVKLNKIKFKKKKRKELPLPGLAR